MIFFSFTNGSRFYSYIDSYWFYILYVKKTKTIRRICFLLSHPRDSCGTDRRLREMPWHRCDASRAEMMYVRSALSYFLI
jgi:hypothetical protein